MGGIPESDRAFDAACREAFKTGVAAPDNRVQKAETGLKYMTVKEAAAAFGVHEDTLRKWIKDKRIECLQPAGRGGKVLIPAAELAFTGAKE